MSCWRRCRVRCASTSSRTATQCTQAVTATPRVSGKTRINLIPYNANAGLGAAGRLFLPSPPEAVQAFHTRLIDLGIICTVRVPRGNEESSACGMLRLKSQ